VWALGGRYRLEERIGAGGMAQVWRGHDAVLDRSVALKLLSGDGSLDRVRTEARSAARLVHPNVASVYDFGIAWFQSRRTPYIVMELVDGGTLAARLRAGPMDWRIAARICAEVCAALAAAHSSGIVHRDVKPANIMLTPTGAKVLDFGIAATTGSLDPERDGTVLGTPAYVAPERLRGAPAAPATDMYAVGVLLYHCLAGRLPWPADTDTQLLRSHSLVPPDPLPLIAGLPDEVADLCERCLDKTPARRPSSLFAALMLAESVDARVYVPPVEPPPMHLPAVVGVSEPTVPGLRREP
jgi:serine/threonine-protein kinase